MKIVIVGAGRVGLTVARKLAGEDCEIVLVDKDAEVLASASQELDVMTLRGNGLRTPILTEAGAPEADLVIAATAGDEGNMLCCLTARRLGARHTIARVRDPEYVQELYALRKELSLSLVVNPEREAAGTIARVLSFPVASDVEPFFDGRVELAALRLGEGDSLLGKPLAEQMGLVSEKVVFCGAERDGGSLIPDGSYVPRAGDLVYIIGQAGQLGAFCKRFGRNASRTLSVFIIGGGRVPYYLSQRLLAAGMEVKIVESNYDRCLELAELLPEAVVIHGDGADQKLLETENLGQYSAMAALTGRDEVNLLTAAAAARQGVQKTVARISREGYDAVVRDLGIDTVIRPETLAAAQVVRYARAMKNAQGNQALTLYQLTGDLEAMEFVVEAATPHLGKPLKNGVFRRDCLAAAILRGGQVRIPNGDDALMLGDKLVVVTNRRGSSTLNDFLL